MGSRVIRLPFCFAALFTLAAVFAPSSAFALGLPGQDDVKPVPRGVSWSLEEQEISGQPGDTVIVHLKGIIPDGWHTFPLTPLKNGPHPTVISAGPAELISFAGEITTDSVAKPNALETKYLSTPTPVMNYEGKVTFAIPLKIGSGIDDAGSQATIRVVSHICNESFCKNDQTIDLPLLIKKKTSATAVIRPDSMTAPLPDAAAKKPLEWIVESCSEAKPDGRFDVVVKCMIENGWHTFPLKTQGEFIPNTSIKLEATDLAAIEGAIVVDRSPKKIYDETLKQDVEIYESAVSFTVPIRLSAAAKPGKVQLALKINSQACKQLCVPVRATVPVTVTVAGALDGPLAACTPPSVQDEEPSDLHSMGFLAFLWAAALAGGISLLTPCVFPMIPITVSFFTKRQHISHARAVRDAFIFSAGIVLAYVGLGFFFALVLGQNTRDLAANPWVNLLIFSVFMVMAFNLFGYYELQIPTGLVNRLNKSAHGGNSIFALLLMGLVFTITSFTCTGPFVGTVMIWAVKGDWVWPLAGMVVFSTVFAAPFFVLALFPAMLKSLPKSGGWLNSVKVVMGFIEIAAALKFLSGADLTWHWGILTREVFDGIWIVVALLAAVYLFGKIRFPHDLGLKKIGALRIAFAFLFLTAAAFVVSDLAGRDVLGPFAAYVPPNPYPPKTTDDWESGLAAARKAGKPVFFDFTGLTCVNCRKMEESMFTRKQIDELMKNFVVVRLYTDAKTNADEIARSERNSKLERERFEFDGLPFYVVVSPDGQTIDKFKKGYTTDEDEFALFLKRAASGGIAAAPVLAVSDWSSGIAAARDTKKLALFKFTASTGMLCPVIEDGLASRQDIKELMKNFVVVKLLTDAQDTKDAVERSALNAKIQRERFKNETQPFFVIVSPDEKELARFEDGCTSDIDKFIDFLKKGAAGQLTAHIDAFQPPLARNSDDE